MAKSKMTTCKSCGNEISAKGKVTCPHCGRVNKKPIYKRFWFIAIVLVLAISVIGGLGSDDSDTPSEPNKVTGNQAASNTSENPATQEEPVSEPKPEPIDVTIDELDEMLETNALKAADTYKGKYVRLTGLLHNVDASGKYFSLESPNAQFTLIGFNCDIKEKHRDTVMNLVMGEPVTVVGTISSVGEVAGYRMDVDIIEAESSASSAIELNKDSTGLVEISVAELNEALDTNPLNASNTFKNLKVRLTGKLSNIDSSGDYFNLIAANEDYAFRSVMCKIKESHLDKVMDFENNQMITVVGEITSVGEVLGYTVEVENIE